MIEMTTKTFDSQAEQAQRPADGWSEQEQQIAQTAFQAAYQREIDALILQVRERSATLDTTDQVWQLHDFLSAQRYELEGKYDYRYPMLLFVFASLVREGWLSLQELDGLAPEKLAKIAALTRVC